jgi:two-component system, cell cycle response regulator
LQDTARDWFLQSKLPGHNYAAAILDIDHFKAVNDRYGHDGGDAVLKSVAAGLAKRSSEICVVGRQGGEEFLILMRKLNREEARVICEALRAEIEAVETVSHNLVGEAQRIRVSASIGFALLAADDASAEDVLRRADAALYRAKAEGRKRVIYA